tara:strand:+ start:1928 stop:2380 length:453 start_codon:yes stop_codon:yes gene_type:complete
MARITVEDCTDKFPSRFELVLIASNRARKLHSGETPTIDRDNDKNTVIALREIAEEKITVDNLKNDLIEEYQTVTLNEDEISDEEEVPSDGNIEVEDDLIESTSVLKTEENSQEKDVLQIEEADDLHNKNNDDQLISDDNDNNLQEDKNI